MDDRPFGGGEGMVMKPEPLFEAVESLLGAKAEAGPPAGTAIVLLSAAGKLFRQETARRFAKLERIVLICGRYEGVDERVAEHLATDEISIGDFVLSGGELPAAMILDAVTRLIPGALGNEDSAVNESFSATEAAADGHVSRAAARPGNLRAPPVAAFSITRITRARRPSAAGKFRKFCSAAIMKKFAAGAASKPSKRRCGTAPTCCPRTLPHPQFNVVKLGRFR